jgi:hypothetical protein
MSDDDEIPDLIATTPGGGADNNGGIADGDDGVGGSGDGGGSGGGGGGDKEAFANAEPVPVTIITGWLGAGKTTLLQHILNEMKARGETVAIIQNEVSNAGVEEELDVDDGGGGVFGDVLELGDGCVCCSVRNDFVLVSFRFSLYFPRLCFLPLRRGAQRFRTGELNFACCS